MIYLPYDNIYYWYKNRFPGDKNGLKLINPNISFSLLWKYLKLGCDFYAICADDSLIRESVFEELSNRLNVSYDYIYDVWIDNKIELRDDEYIYLDEN